jgi:hypothetical protein
MRSAAFPFSGTELIIEADITGPTHSKKEFYNELQRDFDESITLQQPFRDP